MSMYSMSVGWVGGVRWKLWVSMRVLRQKALPDSERQDVQWQQCVKRGEARRV